MRITVDSNGIKTVSNKKTTDCKILKSSSIYYSFAGDTNPSVREAMSKGLLSGNTVYSKRNSCTSRIIDSLYECLHNMRIFDIERYNSLLQKEYLLDVIFYGFNKNKPYLIGVRFYPYIILNNVIGIRFKYQEDVPLKKDTIQFRILGEANYFNQIGYDSVYKALNKNNKPKIIRELITKQSKLTPEIVGEPINVREISKDKITWHPNKNNCN